MTGDDVNDDGAGPQDALGGGDGQPIEDRLRAAMAAGTAAVDDAVGPPVADPVDLGRRRRTRARRGRTAVAAAAVLVALGGSVGGFALGRHGDGGPSARFDPPGGAQEGGGRDRVAATADLPVVVPSVSVPAGERAFGSSGVEGSAAPRFEAGLLGGAGAADTIAFWPLPYGPAQPGRAAGSLYRRTAPDGTELDVRGNRFAAGTAWSGPPWWTPPAWCFPAGDLYVGVRAGVGVGQLTTARYAEVRPGSLVADATVVGGPEGAPRWVAAVQVSTEVVAVQVTFPDGRTERAAPIGGVAVVAAPVRDGFDVDALAVPWGVDVGRSGGPTQPDDELRVEARDESDRVVASAVSPWFGTRGAATRPAGSPPLPDAEPACTAPTVLPAPGPEQPADPTASRLAIEAAWAQALTPGAAPAAENPAIDDPRGVEDARRELLDGPLDAEVLASVRIRVADVVFADPSTAYVRYEVVVDAYGSSLGERFGEARYVDGTWKVTRRTVCALLAEGGGTCEPIG